MADVFVSYVAEDSGIAAEVAHVLGEAGITSWRYEADALGGQNYLLQTRAEIEACRAFVVVLTKVSLGSEQIDREIVRAHEGTKPFLPVLSGITYADYARRRPAWQQAIGAVTALVVPEDGVPALRERLVAGVRGQVKKEVARSPVQDLVVEEDESDRRPEGPGAEFRLSFRVQARKGVPCRAVIRVFEGLRSPYLHEWEPVRARASAWSGPDGNLAVTASFVPTEDPYLVAGLELFIPYAQTPLYDGPQRYEYTAVVEDASGAISPLVVGDFAFTQGRR